MRFFEITVLFGFLGNAAAAMSCTDTLRLTSLEVSRQSLKNTASLGSWTTKVLTKFDATTMLEALPIGLPGLEPGLDSGSSTALHMTQIVTDTCAEGAVTPIEFWRVVDTFRSMANPGSQSVGPVELKTEWLPIWRGADNAFQVGGKVVHAKSQWSSDLFDIGMIQDGDPIGATSAWFIGRSFRKAVPAEPTVNPGVAMAKALTYKLFPLQIDNSIAAGLAAFQPWVDSVRDGSLDSTRFDLVKFRYSYASTLYTGVSRKPGRKRFTVKSSSDGWLITLPFASAVEIVSVDGAVARRIPASVRSYWNGLDQVGVRVRPGIWYAHARGLGVVPIFIR